MTTDGWALITDANKGLIGDLEAAKYSFPLATIYGITDLWFEKWLAFRCHIGDETRHWPHNEPLPDIVWGECAAEYFCMAANIKFTKKKATKLISALTTYWEDKETEEECLQRWEERLGHLDQACKVKDKI